MINNLPCVFWIYPRLLLVEDRILVRPPHNYLITVSLSDTAYVRIFITDVNDNAPAFAQPVYEVSVEEDKEVGFVLITVTANDEDEGESWRNVMLPVIKLCSLPPSLCSLFPSFSFSSPLISFLCSSALAVLFHFLIFSSVLFSSSFFYFPFCSPLTFHFFLSYSSSPLSPSLLLSFWSLLFSLPLLLSLLLTPLLLFSSPPQYTPPPSSLLLLLSQLVSECCCSLEVDSFDVCLFVCVCPSFLFLLRFKPISSRRHKILETTTKQASLSSSSSFSLSLS